MRKSESETHANGATSTKSDLALMNQSVSKKRKEKGVSKATWQLGPKRKGGNTK